MQNAENVTLFPVSRDCIRRRAIHDAENGIPIESTLFETQADQIAYEHAYNAHAMQIAGEIAECA